MQSLQVPLPPRPHSDHAATSGSGSDTGPTDLSVEKSSHQYHSYQHHQHQQQQLTQRLLAVGQRLRSSPPGLLRRMGGGGGGQGQSLDHAPPPSTDIGRVDDGGRVVDESRTEAMGKSHSHFITLYNSNHYSLYNYYKKFIFDV